MAGIRETTTNKECSFWGEVVRKSDNEDREMICDAKIISDESLSDQ